jgi:hypothetical protein
MNPFVNPNKRSILLPPGCKDLIDLLEPQKGSSTELVADGWEHPVIRPERFEGMGLAHVERYVAKVVSSPAKIVTLYIRSLDGFRAIALVRSATEFSIIPLMCMEERGREVEEFFARRGLEAMADFLASDPGMPTRILAFPLPPTASGATGLTVDLLREAYEFGDESGIEFMYVEYNGA